ncbi:MAG: hypothetical protein KGJ35_01780 [Patescibacteria group bacterium]|nr:hypothetical protein [Patescibacteria group bacterium]
MNPQRTTQFLMANLGVEITRLFGYKKNGNIADAITSGKRACKIIDSLESHHDINGGKKEVEMIREVMINDALSIKPKYHVTEAQISSYFAPFSMRALADNGIV